MTEKPKTQIYYTLIVYFLSSKTPKEIKINIESLKTSLGLNDLYSFLSDKFEYQINPKKTTIQIFHMDTWLNLLDIKSFFFFISSDILQNKKTKIKILKKAHLEIINYDEDIIQTNKTKDKPILPNKKISCSICHISSLDESKIERLGKIYGPFKSGNKNYYAHFLCAIWLPQAYINSKNNKFTGVGKEIKRARKIKCTLCGRTGAGIGCLLNEEKKCEESYHYLCAFDAQCEFSKKSYEILCKRHKGKYQFHRGLKNHNNNINDNNNNNNSENNNNINNNIDDDNSNIINNDNDDYDINENNNFESDGFIGRKKLGEKIRYVDEEILKCEFCNMSCDQDKLIECSKCGKNYHEQCVGFNSDNNLINGNLKVIDDDDDDEIKNEFICPNCKNLDNNKKEDIENLVDKK